MSATIYYLRPFERQDLSKTEAEPADAETAEWPAETGEADVEAAPQRKPVQKRSMPYGRKSRFKKRMDGTVVPRDER